VSEYNLLLQSVIDAPADDTVRLAFADHLIDNAVDEYAETKCPDCYEGKQNDLEIGDIRCNEWDCERCGGTGKLGAYRPDPRRAWAELIQVQTRLEANAAYDLGHVRENGPASADVLTIVAESRMIRAALAAKATVVRWRRPTRWGTETRYGRLCTIRGDYLDNPQPEYVFVDVLLLPGWADPSGELRKREAELLPGVMDLIRSQLVLPGGAAWTGGWEMRRGFVDVVMCWVYEFTAFAPTLFRSHPVTQVILHDIEPVRDVVLRGVPLGAGYYWLGGGPGDAAGPGFRLPAELLGAECSGPFASERAARDWLSDLCVAYGRRKAKEAATRPEVT